MALQRFRQDTTQLATDVLIEAVVSVVSTAGGTTLVSAQPNRAEVYLTNQGSVSVYLRSDGVAPTAANGRVLAAGASTPYRHTGAIKALAASGTCDVHVLAIGYPTVT